MKIKEIKIRDLKPYKNNPRFNDDAVDKVVASIKEFGWKVPVVIDKEGVVIAGHTRLRAAEKLGIEKVPCIIADDLTDEQVKAFRLVDNKTAEIAGWDITKLANELSVINVIDMQKFGFEANEFDEISVDDFGEEFELPSGEQNPIRTMTFSLKREQSDLIEAALDLVENEVSETFGNENKKGNELYEVVRQWEEQKK